MKDLRFIHNSKIASPKTVNKTDIETFHKKGETYNEQYKDLRINIEKYTQVKDSKDSNKWKTFKDDFLKLSEFVCPVCETEINNYDDIEHYRPKEHYWWLAYDYTNYSISCDLCNRSYKKELFPLLNPNEQVNFDTKDKINEEKPLLFNPLHDNPLELFEIEIKYGKSGKGEFFIIPKRSLPPESYEYKKAAKTIEVYNLNNDQKSDLVRGNKRQKLYEHFYNLIKTFELFKEEGKKYELSFYSQLQFLKSIKTGFLDFVLAGNYKSIV